MTPSRFENKVLERFERTNEIHHIDKAFKITSEFAE